MLSGSSPRPELIYSTFQSAINFTSQQYVKIGIANPKNRIDLLVMWENPSDERERSKTFPDIIREEEKHEGKNGKVDKKSVSRQSPAINGTLLLWFVESSE